MCSFLPIVVALAAIRFTAGRVQKFDAQGQARVTDGGLPAVIKIDLPDCTQVNYHHHNVGLNVDNLVTLRPCLKLDAR